MCLDEHTEETCEHSGWKQGSKISLTPQVDLKRETAIIHPNNSTCVRTENENLQIPTWRLPSRNRQHVPVVDYELWACFSSAQIRVALWKEVVADTIKSQLRLAFQQVTTFPTLISKLHATVYPTGLVFAIKKKNHRTVWSSLSAGAPTKGNSNRYKFVKFCSISEKNRQN